VSPEQAEADLAAIRGMWELAAVYEFMSTFKHWLNFTQLYPLHDLEEAIVRSPGPGGCVGCVCVGGGGREPTSSVYCDWPVGGGWGCLHSCPWGRHPPSPKQHSFVQFLHTVTAYVEASFNVAWA